MRVGIDHLPGVCHAPGVGRYVRELVRALVRLEDAPELALFEVGGGERSMEAQLDFAGKEVRRLRSRVPRRLVTALHRLTGRGADRLLGGVDLFHRALPDYPPVSHAREVLPVAELPAPGSAADETLGLAARRSAAVLVFSTSYAERVVERYGVPSGRVHRVPVGCEHWTRGGALSPLAQGESGESGESRAPGAQGESGTAPPAGHVPELLVLGATRRERMPLTVLAGFEELRAGGRAARLVFVGHPGSAADELRSALARSPVRADVEWVESPREEHMPARMARSSALVHLAAEEGSPVTPLEAFAAGVPVVASPLPAFREALGTLATFLDATSTPRALATALDATLSANASSASAGAASARRDVAKRYTWEANARATLSVWRGLL